MARHVNEPNVTPRPPAVMSLDEFRSFSGTSRTALYREIKETGQVAGIKAIRIGRRILLPRSRVYEIFGIQA